MAMAGQHRMRAIEPQPATRDEACIGTSPLQEAGWGPRRGYERWAVPVAWTIALLLHGLLSLALWHAAPVAPQAANADRALRVRLIESAAHAPDAVPVPPAAMPARRPAPAVAPELPSARHHEPAAPRDPAESASAPPPASPGVGKGPTLYAPDGSIRLPDAVDPASTFGAPRILGTLDMPKESPLARHVPPLPSRTTSLDSGWAPDREPLPDEWLRRNGVSHEFRTPWGSTIRCALGIDPAKGVAAVGGCGWGAAPPDPRGLKLLRVELPFKPALQDPATGARGAALPAEPPAR